MGKKQDILAALVSDPTPSVATMKALQWWKFITIDDVWDYMVEIVNVEPYEATLNPIRENMRAGKKLSDESKEDENFFLMIKGDEYPKKTRSQAVEQGKRISGVWSKRSSKQTDGVWFYPAGDFYVIRSDKLDYWRHGYNG